jgi:hypothetical protein
MTHTPGPWHVTEDGHIDSSFGAIAEIVGADNPDDETKPNAQLIAMSPALLELCRRSLRALDEDSYPQLRDDLREAIDQVEGAA